MKQINKQKQKKVGICLFVTFGTACFGGVCLLGGLLAAQTRTQHKQDQSGAVPHYGCFWLGLYEVKLDDPAKAITDFDDSYFLDYGFSFRIGSFQLQKGIFFNETNDAIIRGKCFLLPQTNNLSPWWLLTKNKWGNSKGYGYLDLNLYVHYDY